MTRQIAGLLMGCLVLAASSSIQAADPPMNFAAIAPGSLDWVLIPDGLGATYAVVYGDPAEAGTYVIRVRFPAGVMDLPHSHSADRHVTVLEGTWHAGTGPDFDPTSAVALSAGSYMFHPAGGIHWDGAVGDEVAVVQIIGNGPVKTKQEHQESTDWVKVKPSSTAQVMLFGTFHFENPGLDVVKSKDVSVMTEAPQQYLRELAQRLAAWEPTEIALEYDPANDELVNQRYRDYLAGRFELPANEIYQVGFRVAKLARLERVHSFDNRDIEWQAQPMFDYAKAHDSAEMQIFNGIIENFTAEDAQARATLPLKDLLQRANDPELDRLNMDLYLATNSIGAGTGFVGADAAASWWQRNFRMYANVQKLAGPGKRVLVLGGSGHIAILRQFLTIDRRLQGSDIREYL